MKNIFMKNIKISKKNIPTSKIRFSSLVVSLLVFASNAPSGSLAQAAGIQSPELPDLVEKLLPGVVNISTFHTERYTVYGSDDFYNFWGVPKEQRQQQGLGTGFIISKDGFVLTNNHVIDQADEVVVTLLNRKSYKARVVGKDQKLDLALLKIIEKEGVALDFSPVPLGDSSKVRIAESIFAIGNPFGLGHTVTAGIISAKNRTIGMGPLDDFLQTDASINPGNSGGPLFNLKGEVIGINSSIFSLTKQSAGLGFAIPINAVKDVLDSLKKHGRVPRPWIGVFGQAVNERLQAYYHLPVAEGVIVANLVEGGPALKVGLLRGDIITHVDGEAVVENSQIEHEIYKKKPGEQVTLKIKRGKKTIDQKIKLDALPKLDQLPQGII